MLLNFFKYYYNKIFTKFENIFSLYNININKIMKKLKINSNMSIFILIIYDIQFFKN
jgi:hypothetical protein